MNDYFLFFSMQFDRDKGLDFGRLSLNSLSQGTRQIWISTTSTANRQKPEDFHQKGGPIPPQYRCGIKNWEVITLPIPMPSRKGVEGNFFKINPHTVTTDKNGFRGDFGIHRDANAPGSLGCIVLSNERFRLFEKSMKELSAKGIKQLPLFVQYS